MALNIGKFELSEEENNKVENLRKLITNCSKLKIGTEVEILGRYLYCNDWDVEKAYKHIHEYYDFKNKYPDWITTEQTPDFYKEIIDLNTRILLPHTDKEGKFIIIHKIVNAFDKIENYNIKISQLDDLIYESILSSPRGQKYGITTIMDTDGINTNYVKCVTPSIATMIGKKSDILPMRLEDKRGHFIIRSVIINSILSILLPFLGSVRKLGIFHKIHNLDKLKEYVGQENLPYEFGGPEINVFDSSFYLEKFLQSRYNYVKKSQKYYKEN